MERVSVFRRVLKTARGFVFENILDLDHVCVVHLRWFRDLCVIVRRPDYVEYRLGATFYGIKQDMLVKGAVVDPDRYWYDFNGPLVSVRVDGTMEGSDGDLLLTEVITYRFPWILAPVLWVLGPLFRKQKEDILLADSRLLERVYALDRAGFKRFVET